MWNRFLVALIAYSIAFSSSSFADQDLDDTFRNRSSNPVTGALLGEKQEWIWVRTYGESVWRKLIPGRCPQWYLDGKRFYYFLDVGYDGNRAELWSANAEGEARVRLTQSDYFIASGPVVVSPDSRSLAFSYHTSRASGDYHDIVVVDFLSSPMKPTEGRVVFRTKSSVDPQTLQWSAAGRLSVAVDGVQIEIDAMAPGVPQAP